MQITIKSSKVGKRGENKYGPWALVVVATDKDVEYTTLAEGAEKIAAGMVVDIDQLSIEEKDGKERRSFKKFEIISGAKATAVNGKGEARQGMTPDQWAEKDRLEQRSIEAQTAFKGIVELAKIQNEEPLPSSFPDVLKSALDWALAHFEKPSEAAKGYHVPHPEESEEKAWEGLKSESGEFKNVGEFLTRVTKELKLTRAEICGKLSINDVSEITDFNKAWKDLRGDK